MVFLLGNEGGGLEISEKSSQQYDNEILMRHDHRFFCRYSSENRGKDMQLASIKKVQYFFFYIPVIKFR